MKLRGKPRETAAIELASGEVDGKPYRIEATVAYLTRKDQTEILNAAAGYRWDPDVSNGKGGLGAVVTDFELDKQLCEKLRRQVPSVTGLTVDALLAVAELPPHVEIDVEVSESGEVAWDHDRIVFTESHEFDSPTPKKPNRKRTKTASYTLPAFLYTYAPPSFLAEKLDQVQADFQRAKAEAEKKSDETSDA